MKTSPKSAKTRAWKALSLYIRARDKQCVTCGRPATQCGHYKHNSDKPNKTLGGNELWYYEKNFGGQCTYCNCYNAGELDKFAIHLEKKYGHGILQELETLYRKPKKWTIEEILEVEKFYQSNLERLSKL